MFYVHATTPAAQDASGLSHMGHEASLLFSQRRFPSEAQDVLKKLGQLTIQEAGYEQQHAAFQSECNKCLQQMTKCTQQHAFLQQMTKFMQLVRNEQQTFDAHLALLRRIRAHAQELLEDLVQLTGQLALHSVARRSATS